MYKDDSNDPEVALWQAYQKDKSSINKEKIILYHLPLVRKIAQMMAVQINHKVEVCDLESEGVLGLMDAIDKFDLDKDLRFSTYGSLRIRGAMVDYLRQLDFGSRRLREKSRNLEASKQKWYHDFGREPSDAELANHSGFSVQEVQDVKKHNHETAVSSLEDYLTRNEDWQGREIKSSASTPEELFLEIGRAHV